MPNGPRSHYRFNANAPVSPESMSHTSDGAETYTGKRKWRKWEKTSGRKRKTKYRRRRKTHYRYNSNAPKPPLSPEDSSDGEETYASKKQYRVLKAEGRIPHLQDVLRTASPCLQEVLQKDELTGWVSEFIDCPYDCKKCADHVKRYLTKDSTTACHSGSLDHVKGDKSCAQCGGLVLLQETPPELRSKAAARATGSDAGPAVESPLSYPETVSLGFELSPMMGLVTPEHVDWANEGEEFERQWGGEGGVEEAEHIAFDPPESDI